MGFLNGLSSIPLQTVRPAYLKIVHLAYLRDPDDSNVLFLLGTFRTVDSVKRLVNTIVLSTFLLYQRPKLTRSKTIH